MTDQITADEYRIAAKVLRGNCNRPGFPYSVRSAVDACEQQAANLDREAACDVEAEELALAISGYVNPEIVEEDHRRYARRALDHLADRLAPAGGVVLTADEVADLRWLLNTRVRTPQWRSASDRLRAKLAPRQVHNHGTEDGPGLACQERQMGGLMVGACIAGPWPTVANIPDDVDRVRDHGGIEWRRDCAGWWSPDALDAGIAYATAPFVRVDAEKPAPRSWPSLDQVPHDVVVKGSNGQVAKFLDGRWRWVGIHTPVASCLHDEWAEVSA